MLLGQSAGSGTRRHFSHSSFLNALQLHLKEKQRHQSYKATFPNTPPTRCYFCSKAPEQTFQTVAQEWSLVEADQTYTAHTKGTGMQLARKVRMGIEAFWSYFNKRGHQRNYDQNCSVSEA